MSWLVAVAMPQEARLLCARLEPAPSLGGRGLWQGMIGGQGLRLVLTGMGLVNAAQAVTACLEHLDDIEAVINLGCAGAYAQSGLGLGDAALATEVALADHGIRTCRRLHGLDKTGIPLHIGPQGEKIYHRFPCDAGLRARLARPGLAQGAYACVVQVSGDPETAAGLEERWGAVLEDMESGAVAQVAAHYGLPFAAIRGVSNLAGRRELDVAQGAEAAQRAFIAALEDAP